MTAAVAHMNSKPTADVDRTGFTAQVMQGGDVITAEEWDSLSLNALEENPFLGRRFVRADLLAFGQRGLRIVTLRDPAGRLVGLVPYRPGNLFAVVAGREVRIALNDYQPEGVPLIHRECADGALHAFSDLILSGAVPSRWVFPQVGLDGPFLRELRAVARQRGLLCHSEYRFDRPVLTRMPEGFEAHAEKVIGKKRVKDIERNLRRLGELGSVRFERATEHAHVRLRLDAFLQIENAGWKGAAGTAFLARAYHARFARFAFGGATPGEGITSVDSLLLDGVPIALSVNLRSGGRVFTAKCTYDEAYRKYGPGMVLEYLVIRHFYAHPDDVEMDAATTAGGHVISGLWNAKRAMAVVTLGPDNVQTRMAIDIHAAKYRLRQAAKRLLRRG